MADPKITLPLTKKTAQPKKIESLKSLDGQPNTSAGPGKLNPPNPHPTPSGKPINSPNPPVIYPVGPPIDPGSSPVFRPAPVPGPVSPVPMPFVQPSPTPGSGAPKPKPLPPVYRPPTPSDAPKAKSAPPVAPKTAAKIKLAPKPDTLKARRERLNRIKFVQSEKRNKRSTKKR